MKRMLSVLIIVVSVCFLWSDNLLANYDFQYSVGSYISISDGSTLGSPSMDSQYIVYPLSPAGSVQYWTGPGFPIGFQFDFAGDTFDRVGVHVDGWISLGKSSLGENAVDMRSTDISKPLNTIMDGQADQSLVARISGLGMDLQAQSGSNIYIKQSGTAPNRVLTVQWEHLRKKNNEGDSFNFQIQLLEAGMQIKINYGEMQASTTSSCHVGLRAAPVIPAGNFSNRVVSNGGDWATSNAGTDPDDRVVFSSAQLPAFGASYIWTPPVGLQSDFRGDILSGTAPLTVQFTDLSIEGSAPITSWQWDFGGQSSSLQNPQISFTQPGVYDVTLTVGDGISYASETKYGYIQVLSGTIPEVNTTIQMDGNDAIISWNHIYEDEYGNSIIPQYYFLYFNGSDDAFGNYYFLAPIAYPATEYRHSGVGMGAEHMFYRVTAVCLEP